MSCLWVSTVQAEKDFPSSYVFLQLLFSLCSSSPFSTGYLLCTYVLQSPKSLWHVLSCHPKVFWYIYLQIPVWCCNHKPHCFTWYSLQITDLHTQFCTSLSSPQAWTETAPGMKSVTLLFFSTQHPVLAVSLPFFSCSCFFADKLFLPL